MEEVRSRRRVEGWVKRWELGKGGGKDCCFFEEGGGGGKVWSVESIWGLMLVPVLILKKKREVRGWREVR